MSKSGVSAYQLKVTSSDIILHIPIEGGDLKKSSKNYRKYSRDRKVRIIYVSVTLVSFIIFSFLIFSTLNHKVYLYIFLNTSDLFVWSKYLTTKIVGTRTASVNLPWSATATCLLRLSSAIWRRCQRCSTTYAMISIWFLDKHIHVKLTIQQCKVCKMTQFDCLPDATLLCLSELSLNYNLQQWHSISLYLVFYHLIS